MKPLACIFFLMLIGFTIPIVAQEVLAPNSNLVLNGVPEIPSDLARNVGRYSQYRSASFSGWLPGEDGMLITTRFGNASQIHRVSNSGGAREQVTFFPEPVRGAAVRPGHNDSFAFVRDSGGDEFYQIYLFNMNTGEATLLSDGEKRNGSPLWSRDGSQLVYSRVDANEKGAFTELYITNPDRLGEERLLARLDGGSWRAVDFSPNGERLTVIEYISANKSNIWAISLENGSKYPLSYRTLDEKVANRGGIYTSDGRSLFITTDEGSEFRKLTRVTFKGNPVETTSEEIDWDVSQFELSPDGETLAFVTNEAGIGKLYLRSAVYSSSVSEIIDLPSIPVGTLSGIEWHPTKPVIGFTLRSANTPGDVYSVNVETGEVTRWTYSETGSVDADSFNEPEFISWKSFDGLEITGFMYRPPAKFTGKRPEIGRAHV